MLNRPEVSSRSRWTALTAVRVGKLVGLKFGWALIPTTVVMVLASVHWASSGEPGFFMLSGTLALHVVVGAAGSYVVHEVGHVIAMGLFCPQVHSIEIRSDFLRFSIVPHGSISRAGSILVALSGPGLCGLLGLLTLQVTGSSVGWWYVAHLVFLVPPFGDGMSILRVSTRRLPANA